MLTQGIFTLSEAMSITMESLAVRTCYCCITMCFLNVELLQCEECHFSLLLAKKKKKKLLFVELFSLLLINRIPSF